jgi:hypothetical protein
MAGYCHCIQYRFRYFVLYTVPVLDEGLDIVSTVFIMVAQCLVQRFLQSEVS